MNSGKRYLLPIIIFLLIAIHLHSQDEITSEGDSEEEIFEEDNRYSSWEFGISFTIPDGWEKKKRPGYLVRIIEKTDKAEFSVKARLLSEIIPVENFVTRMEREMKMNEGYNRYNLKDTMDDESFWSGEFTISPDTEGWSNPYEILLYDDEPDEGLIEEIKKQIEEMEEKQREDMEEIELPLQTEITYLYDKSGERNLIVYCIKGNVGYTFKMTSTKTRFTSYLPIFNDILRDIDVRHIYGGQYGVEKVIEVDVENSGVISGKVLFNGITFPDVSVYLYSSLEDYRAGNVYKSIKSNYYGEYWFVEIEPGGDFIIDAKFIGDGKKLNAYSPIDDIEVSKGKVTFVNIELIE